MGKEIPSWRDHEKLQAKVHERAWESVQSVQQGKREDWKEDGGDNNERLCESLRRIGLEECLGEILFKKGALQRTHAFKDWRKGEEGVREVHVELWEGVQDKEIWSFEQNRGRAPRYVRTFMQMRNGDIAEDSLAY